MNTYSIYWAKTYFRTGRLKIEAESEEDAYEKVDEMIGDLEGSLQYCPDENLIEINEVEYKYRRK